MSYDEGDIVQYLYSVHGFAQTVNRKDFVADFAVGTEIDVWILTAGGFDVIQLDFFEGAFSGSRLLGFGSRCV